MRWFDNWLEIALAIIFIMFGSVFCLYLYKQIDKPSELELLTKYLIAKDSLMTKAKLDSLNERIKK